MVRFTRFDRLFRTELCGQTCGQNWSDIIARHFKIRHRRNVPSVLDSEKFRQYYFVLALRAWHLTGPIIGEVSTIVSTPPKRPIEK